MNSEFYKHDQTSESQSLVLLLCPSPATKASGHVHQKLVAHGRAAKINRLIFINHDSGDLKSTDA